MYYNKEASRELRQGYMAKRLLNVVLISEFCSFSVDQLLRHMKLQEYRALSADLKSSGIMPVPLCAGVVFLIWKNNPLSVLILLCLNAGKVLK